MNGDWWLIPRPIPTGFELLPGSGWGLAQIGEALGGVAVGVGLAALAAAVHAPLAVITALALGVGGLGVALAAPMGDSGAPLWEVVGAMRSYARRPRRWLVDYAREDVS